VAKTQRQRKQRGDRATQAQAREAPKPSTTQASPVSKQRAALFVQVKPGRSERVVLASIVAVALIGYVNSLSGKFVYDDTFQILRNPTLRSLSNIPAMFTQGVWQFMDASSQGAVGLYYRPMFNSLLILNFSLFGFSPTGWHVVSVILHLGSTLLVYALARRWSLSREASALAAMLFGVHPVHSESVAWISGVPDPLAAVFVLMALLFYCRYFEEQGSSRSWLVWSVITATLAMFTKEVAIVIPVFILIIELVQRADAESLTSAFMRAVQRGALFFGAAVLYLLARYGVLGFISKPELKAAGVTSAQVVLTLPSVVAEYARLLVLPYPLSIVYDHPFVNSASDPRFWAVGIAVAAGLVLLGWVCLKSKPGLRAFAVMLLFLVPVLNLKAFNPQESIVHDRYLYLPSVGFCFLIALGLDWLSRHQSTIKRFVPAISISLCAVFLLLLVYQNSIWHDDVSMAEHGLANAPGRPFLYNYLGAYSSDHNNLEDAQRYLNQAVALDPRYYDALSNLGDVYFKQQNWGAAERAYQQAVDAGAPYSQTYYNLGDVLTRQHKLVEARAPLQKVLEIQPNKSDALFYLGWLDQQENKLASAERYYAKALEVKPDYIEARINLGVVYTDEGRIKDGIEQLEAVKRIAPQHPVMLYSLAEAYRKSDRAQDAVALLKQLIAAEPRHQRAYTSLGLCYEALKDPALARENFEKAVAIAPGDPYTATAREHLGDRQ